MWSIDGPQGNESAKVRWDMVRYTRGKVLDLGCGAWKTFPHFIGVDNNHHRETYKWDPNAPKPDFVVDSCEKLDIFASAHFDAVVSSHLLEHIVDTEGALREWWRVIKQGGHLVLYLPHKDFYPNIGEKGGNPDHKHDFLPQDIINVMRKIGGWDLIENQERNKREEYSFFQVYRKRNDRQCLEPYKTPKPVKTVAICRYGAFGDMIMASSIFPGLKEQGYHITLYTGSGGYDVIKNDPHLDEIIVQDKDQVPNGELHSWWAWLTTQYTKFINLSETVEGAWLAIPGRGPHMWPHELRHKYLNKNYIEFQHEIAGVPLPQKGRFYATDDEKKWANRERKKHSGKVILWSLAGSAVHKMWPHTDQIMCRILYAYKDSQIYLVGDGMCQILEQGWKKEKRVHRRSGVWTIRESMSFAENCNLIIGCETGLLNAAAILPVPKIVFLSHSSHENLTKHWRNTTAMEPELTACFPCHRMHYGKDFCHEEKDTHAALCQYNIPVNLVWDEVVGVLGKPDVEIPEEYQPTIVIHDNRALLKQNIEEAVNGY